jgi:hypothetical protein
MNKLDPHQLFSCIATDIPRELHGSLFVTGSLAAAYRFQAQLDGLGVNTKDADVVVHPAGNVASCGQMAKILLTLGWLRTEECYPQPAPDPGSALRAIRLFPPGSRDYYLEFLGLPATGQRGAKVWMPIEMDDGYYGLPCFRFANIVSVNRLTSAAGIEYASASMMALANLLSHPTVGADRIESGSMRGLLRSAKDLGRVIALAYLTGREETETWPELWLDALQRLFPAEWRTLANHVGDGLTELLENEYALDNAWKTTETGLLSGKSVLAKNLKATGQRLLVDVVEPVVELARHGD